MASGRRVTLGAVTRTGWPASCVRSARNTGEAIMRQAKIAVAGASGRLGRHVVGVLGAAGHEVVPISRSAGVDVITGDGLADALKDAGAIIDVTAGPSSEQRAATEAGDGGPGLSPGRCH